MHPVERSAWVYPLRRLRSTAPWKTLAPGEHCAFRARCGDVECVHPEGTENVTQ
jgi:hypothetical protein